MTSFITINLIGIILLFRNNRIVWQEVDPNLRIATNDVWVGAILFMTTYDDYVVMMIEDDGDDYDNDDGDQWW